ncbi:MAG TPA: allantoinase AllB [Polyangiaceae bacterium]|jgi:allantoinase|nr:allantoinase AllB [Polyangiaceae bacterium]
MAHAIKSTRVVQPSGVAPATVVIEGGVIASVGAHAPSGVVVEDLGTLVVSPGLVDCHVHLNEPGRTEWEGFETGTRAAAAGGVTTLVDMPLNCIPVTTSRAALDAKLAAAGGRCFVDIGFWGGVVPGNTGDLAGLAEGGVLGCKAFLVHSGIDDFPNATASDLAASMPVLRDHGLPLLAHAELDLGAGDAKDASPRAYGAYLASRPPSWEDEAVKLLVGLCRQTRCPVHIVHLSSASSIDALRAAKDEGLPVTVETCPHYLCLEAESIPDGATLFKCAPPIRERANRELLWKGLFDGVIDFVITDHSPCAPALKLAETGDFQQAWGGIASLQLGLPNVWTAARRRGASLTQIAQWLSTRPAAFAGLGHRKGRVAAGYDADLVVWDPDAAFSPASEDLFFRHKVCPYLGADLTGRVRRTVLRGTTVFDGSAHPAGAVGQSLLGRNPPRNLAGLS